MKHKLESRLLGEISITSDILTTPLLSRKQRRTRACSWKRKMKKENVGLKLNIQKTKVMASGPITSRQIDGETVAEVLSSQSYGFSSGHVWM